MFKQKLLLSTIGAALLLTAGTVIAAPSLSIEQVIAREASEGPRGGDNERPGDRQRRGGRVSEDAGDMILARRGADDPPGTERPGDNHRQRRGGRNGAIDNPADSFVIAREASEGPRGGDNEAPGDRQRRNRGGRNA